MNTRGIQFQAIPVLWLLQKANQSIGLDVKVGWTKKWDKIFKRKLTLLFFLSFILSCGLSSKCLRSRQKNFNILETCSIFETENQLLDTICQCQKFSFLSDIFFSKWKWKCGKSVCLSPLANPGLPSLLTKKGTWNLLFQDVYGRLILAMRKSFCWSSSFQTSLMYVCLKVGEWVDGGGEGMDSMRNMLEAASWSVGDGPEVGGLPTSF